VCIDRGIDDNKGAVKKLLSSFVAPWRTISAAAIDECAISI